MKAKVFRNLLTAIAMRYLMTETEPTTLMAKFVGSTVGKPASGIKDIQFCLVKCEHSVLHTYIGTSFHYIIGNITYFLEWIVYGSLRYNSIKN
jgi:hypothetical protein